jgi:hypothetical protein
LTSALDPQFAALDALVALHSRYERVLKALRQAIRNAHRFADADVHALLGESRTGKTRLAEILEAEFPRQRTPEGAEVPILRVTIPRKPTTKGVISLMLHGLGDPAFASGTEIAMMIRLINLVRKLKVRVIVPDEFQHFVSERGHVNYDVSDTFKVLGDETGTALIAIGLPSARAVIAANEQLAGRAMRPLYLPRFDWSIDKDRQEFTKILANFSSGIDLKWPDFQDEAWAYRWWCATGGLIGYVNRICRKVLMILDESGGRTVTLKVLDQAHLMGVFSASAARSRPFEASFSVTPSAEGIAQAKLIGTRPDDQRDSDRADKTGKK